MGLGTIKGVSEADNSTPIVHVLLVQHDSFNYQLPTVISNKMSSDSVVPETNVLAIASHVGMQPPCHSCVSKADTLSRLFMGESTCWPAGPDSYQT